MTDKIIIKDLRVRGILGIYPKERVQTQNILINIIMYASVRPAAASDAIEDAVDYERVSRRIIEHVATAVPLLAEKLASDIAGIILTEFGVERVRVRVEKPDALPFARSVGVEIERASAD